MSKSVFNYLDTRNCTAKGHPPPPPHTHPLCSFVCLVKETSMVFVYPACLLHVLVSSVETEHWKVAMILMCEMGRLLPLCEVVSPLLAFHFVRGLLVCVFASPCPFGPVRFVVDFVLAD